MKIEEHLKLVKESQELLNYAIEKGLENHQRTVGFNTSAAAADLFEIYLHKKNLIDPGFMVKHEWFASKNKIRDKIRFDFSYKKEIIDLLTSIEVKRNALCYGKQQKENFILESVENFNRLKQKLKEVGLDEEV